MHQVSQLMKYNYKLEDLEILFNMIDDMDNLEGPDIFQFTFYGINFIL